MGIFTSSVVVCPPACAAHEEASLNDSVKTLTPNLRRLPVLPASAARCYAVTL